MRDSAVPAPRRRDDDSCSKKEMYACVAAAARVWGFDAACAYAPVEAAIGRGLVARSVYFDVPEDAVAKVGALARSSPAATVALQRRSDRSARGHRECSVAAGLATAEAGTAPRKLDGGV